jgi:16S rRNA C967 or C1407 C5-methylase (RsmB/RsmF family)
MMNDKFLEMVKGLPSLDHDRFLAAMEQEPAISVKLNRRKCRDITEIGYGEPTRVAWCESGYYLEERPKFTFNPLLHAGLFYVQDASSMIYETLTARILEMMDLETPSVIDLCAAPGGKTTSMINALPDGSLVVANEFTPQRAKILTENLLKWGYPEIMVTNSPTGKAAAVGELFDIVAVDAPCSGEGMMRKDETACTQWGPGLVAQCAALQREILENAVAMLRPAGFMIYSTCTFNTEEDEQNLQYLIEELGMEPVDMQLPKEWGIGSQLTGDYPAMRFMPHLTRGEGLFAAVVRKPGDAAQTAHSRIKDAVKKRMRVILDGIPHTELKGKVEAPLTEWALSSDFPAGKYPEVELDEMTALQYLRHEAITLPAETERGYVVVKYRGARLGVVKNLGNRANNLYPAEWRIRMKN